MVAEETIVPGFEFHVFNNDVDINLKQEGNRMPLKYIPLKRNVCLLETIPGSGANLIRSAGSTGFVLKKDGC